MISDRSREAEFAAAKPASAAGEGRGGARIIQIEQNIFVSISLHSFFFPMSSFRPAGMVNGVHVSTKRIASCNWDFVFSSLGIESSPHSE